MLKGRLTKAEEDMTDLKVKMERVSLVSLNAYILVVVWNKWKPRKQVEASHIFSIITNYLFIVFL